MALRWLEGFDVNISSDGDGYDIRYETAVLPATLAFVSGRFFGSALSARTEPTKLTLPAMTSDNTWIVGMHVLFNSIEPASDLIDFLAGGVHQFKLQGTPNTDGGVDFSFIRGSTTLETFTLESPSDWIHIELKVVIHNSTGSYEVRVNELSVASDSGVNTANTGSPGCDQLRFWFEIPSATTTFFAVDNLFVLDGTGSINDDFIGEMVVEEKLPRVAGAFSEWDPKNPGEINYQNIDEEGEPDKDTTYNATEDIDITDTFVMFPLNVLSVILGIQTETVAAVQGSAENLKAVVFINTNEYVSDGESVTTVTPIYMSTHFEWDESPDSSSAFTAEELALAEFGYRSIA